MSSVNSASIDPPHEIIDKYCPLHGWVPDPDEAYERRRDEERELSARFDGDYYE
jgi:hypothetical protein